MSWFGAACDCHVHVIGEAEAFPQLPHRTYTAAPAPLETLRHVASQEGVSCFVIVQPSFYGTDNACTVAALHALGNLGRGVAVLDPGSTDPGTLRALDAVGVRGLRINLYSTVSQREGRRTASLLSPTISLAARCGWHVQLLAPLPVLLEAAPVIGAAPVPVVLDHYGLFGAADPSSPAGTRLLDLVARPHLWVKLSAPYRVMGDPLATRPPAAWLSAFLQVAPDRCVWGSDWPHTPPHAEQTGHQRPLPHRNLPYGKVLGDFAASLPNDASAHRVLVDNPRRLYRFPP